tara:strand:- start:161 stop:487 length:327 start_codon:yes stop_codon:yes gene_type:complete
MKPLLSLSEVTDAQKLQRPLVHCIHADFIVGGNAAGEAKISESFDADAFAAEAISPQAITCLKESQSHALCFFTGAIHTAEAFVNLKNAALASRSRVDQHGLVARHRH